jgi:hypothetical protein
MSTSIRIIGPGGGSSMASQGSGTAVKGLPNGKGGTQILTAAHVVSPKQAADPSIKIPAGDSGDTFSASSSSGASNGIRPFEQAVKVQVIDDSTGQVIEEVGGEAKAAVDSVGGEGDVSKDIAMVTTDKPLQTQVESYAIAKPGSKHDPNTYRVENPSPGGKSIGDVAIKPENADNTSASPVANNIVKFDNPGGKIDKGASGAVITAINTVTGEREIVSNVSVGNNGQTMGVNFASSQQTHKALQAIA